MHLQSTHRSLNTCLPYHHRAGPPIECLGLRIHQSCEAKLPRRHLSLTPPLPITRGSTPRSRATCYPGPSIPLRASAHKALKLILSDFASVPRTLKFKVEALLLGLLARGGALSSPLVIFLDLLCAGPTTLRESTRLGFPQHTNPCCKALLNSCKRLLTLKHEQPYHFAGQHIMSRGFDFQAPCQSFGHEMDRAVRTQLTPSARAREPQVRGARGGGGANVVGRGGPDVREPGERGLQRTRPCRSDSANQPTESDPPVAGSDLSNSCLGRLCRLAGKAGWLRGSRTPAVCFPGFLADIMFILLPGFLASCLAGRQGGCLPRNFSWTSRLKAHSPKEEVSGTPSLSVVLSLPRPRGRRPHGLPSHWHRRRVPPTETRDQTSCGVAGSPPRASLELDQAMAHPSASPVEARPPLPSRS